MFENYQIVDNHESTQNPHMPMIGVTGCQFAAARALACLSRQELADRAGLSYHSIRAWERSSNSIPEATYGHLLRAVEALGATGVRFSENGVYLQRPAPIDRGHRSPQRRGCSMTADELINHVRNSIDGIEKVDGGPRDAALAIFRAGMTVAVIGLGRLDEAEREYQLQGLEDGARDCLAALADPGARRDFIQVVFHSCHIRTW